jgi:iron complex outermembrane receptor protein
MRHLLARGEGVVRELSYDIAGYFTSVANEIVPYRGGRFYFTAGRVHRMGAELGVNARLAHGWHLTGALTTSSNTYDEYVVDSVHYGKPGRFADYSGNDVVGVPKVHFTGSVSWAPARARGMRVQVGVQQTGRYFADDANRISVPASTILSAGLHADRVIEVGGGLGLRGSLTVQNLADRRYIASAFLNPDVVSNAPVAFEPGLPRQVILTFSLARAK